MSRAAHLLAVARSLPPSPLKAPGTPQLSDALEKIITRTFPTSVDEPSAAASAYAATRLTGPSEERAIDRMTGSLERIKSNSILQQYPLSSNTLQPAHDPLYYKRMLDGVHRAQQGVGRSWWRRFFQVKGEA